MHMQPILHCKGQIFRSCHNTPNSKMPAIRNTIDDQVVDENIQSGVDMILAMCNNYVEKQEPQLCGSCRKTGNDTTCGIDDARHYAFEENPSRASVDSQAHAQQRNRVTVASCSSK